MVISPKSITFSMQMRACMYCREKHEQGVLKFEIEPVSISSLINVIQQF